MNDEDIYAFNPVPRTPAPPPRPPRRVWPWVVGALLVLATLAAFGGAAALMAWVDGSRDGLHLFIDGDDWSAGHVGLGHGLAAALAALLALSACLLLLLLVVPVTLALVALALALALGAVLLAVGVVAAIALSPLWGLGLLLWLALRPRRAPPAAARMAA